MKKIQRKIRHEKLEKLSGGTDQDIFGGRFGKRRDKKSHDTTSSTRLSLKTDARVKGEDDIAKFLNTELRLFFSNQQDGTLFVKVLVADGIAP